MMTYDECKNAIDEIKVITLAIKRAVSHIFGANVDNLIVRSIDIVDGNLWAIWGEYEAGSSISFTPEALYFALRGDYYKLSNNGKGSHYEDIIIVTK